MNKIYILITLFSLNWMQAQTHEIGIFAGGSNYMGDIGPTDFVASNKLAYGFIYKWNKSPRHSYRFSYTQSTINASDLDSGVPSRYLRGLSFSNNLKEFSVGLEFNFFDFDLHQTGWKTTPYVYSGINYLIYDEQFFLNKELKFDYTSSNFSVPMVVGVKTNLTNHLILGLEVGVRYAFTDNLDGTKPKNVNLKSLRFGNTQSNDWYAFSGFTLTYTFGRKPCYCNN